MSEQLVAYMGCKGFVAQDEDTWDPRVGQDCATRIWAWHKRYILGDQDPEKPDTREFGSWAEVSKEICEKHDVLLIKQVRMYDHSGLGVSLSSDRYPFNCPWDSGWVGFIFITREATLKALCAKRVTSRVLKQAEALMESEFEEWAAYVRSRC